LSSPGFSFTIFTTEGPAGAAAFLYLKSVVELFVLQPVFGRLNVIELVPSSNVIEESLPPTGSDPKMLMPGSFEIRTTFGVPLSNSFLPVIPWSAALVGMNIPDSAQTPTITSNPDATFLIVLPHR
jgi:hypothetical protein